MPDYSQSKIYKIQPIIEHDEGDIYIGSTTKKLNTRFSVHKSRYKYYIENKYGNNTSYYLFEKYGVENCEIVLLEDVECDCKRELELKEKHYILNNKCVNKVIPIQTEEEYKKYQAEYHVYYRELNKEAIAERTKNYREQNKTIIAEKLKNYYQQNKTAIVEKSKNYYQQNKEKIKNYYGRRNIDH